MYICIYYFHRLGYPVKDLNDGNATGFSTVQMTVDEGKRMSSAKGTIHKSRHVNCVQTNGMFQKSVKKKEKEFKKKRKNPRERTRFFHFFTGYLVNTYFVKKLVHKLVFFCVRSFMNGSKLFYTEKLYQEKIWTLF